MNQPLRLTIALASSLIAACSGGGEGSSPSPGNGSPGAAGATSSAPSSPPDPGATKARPVLIACTRSSCDVDYDACKEGSGAACASCLRDCASIEVDMGTLCTCEDLCAAPKTDGCAVERSQCEEAPRCLDETDADGKAVKPTWKAPWKPPAPPHAGACSEEDLDDFMSTCGKYPVSAECSDFHAAHPGCYACAITPAAAAAWGPMVVDGNRTWLNTEGCLGLVAGDLTCSSQVFDSNVCLGECEGAADRNACLRFAAANDCEDAASAASACVHALGADQPGSAFVVCGDPTAVGSTPATLHSMFRFFCGT